MAETEPTASATIIASADVEARRQTARELERLRQERETFDQRKHQDHLWFRLRLGMGIIALVLLPSIMVVASYILVSGGQSASVEALAGAALFGDVLGVVASIWKIVVGSGSPARLEPVTSPVED